MAQQKSLSEQLPLTEKTPLFGWLKRLLGILEARFVILEATKGALELAIQQVREVALFRINEVLLPSVARIQQLTALGFLIAKSSGGAKLELGAKTFVIDAGVQRDLFTPSPYVMIEAEGDRDTYAIARRDAYDPETGGLEVVIVQRFGSTAIRTDWVISATPGATVSTRQNASNAAVSAAAAAQSLSDVIAARTAVNTDIAALRSLSNDTLADLRDQAAASKTAAAGSAAAAAGSAADAVTTLGQVNAVYDQFDDRWLGIKSADPTKDNDGNALVPGTAYYYDGSNGGNAGLRVRTPANTWDIGYFTGGVSFFKGRQGSVVPMAGDYTALMITGLRSRLHYMANL